MAEDTNKNMVVLCVNSTSSPDSKPVPNRCRLLELPAELRNEIWSLALSQPTGVVTCFPYNIKEEKATERAGLLRTCKQIHLECGDLFFSLNEFIFDFYHEAQLPRPTASPKQCDEFECAIHNKIASVAKARKLRIRISQNTWFPNNAAIILKLYLTRLRSIIMELRRRGACLRFTVQPTPGSGRGFAWEWLDFEVEELKGVHAELERCFAGHSRRSRDLVEDLDALKLVADGCFFDGVGG